MKSLSNRIIIGIIIILSLAFSYTPVGNEILSSSPPHLLFTLVAGFGAVTSISSRAVKRLRKKEHELCRRVRELERQVRCNSHRTYNSEGLEDESSPIVGVGGQTFNTHDTFP